VKSPPLCKLAGITRVILYRHFDSKPDLCQAVLDRFCAVLSGHVAQPVGGFTDASRRQRRPRLAASSASWLEHIMNATPEDNAKVLRAWEKTAPGYDKQIAIFGKIWFTGGREWLGARAQGRVLEVAIGTGLNLPHYPIDTTIIGIELSPAMLAIAKRRAADLGRDVDLHNGDAQALPFADDEFDTVVCALSLCTIPDPATAIGQMKRVLVPGGRLLLLDHIRSTWPPIHAAQWLLERVTIRAAGEHFTRRQLPLVRAAGFEIVEVERLKAGTIERIHARKPMPGS
jgi:ubiquinone/menaquinone biosynthesis C-methylase UbiE